MVVLEVVWVVVAGEETTEYPVIVEPPFDEGADHVTVAVVLPDDMDADCR
jgi:hypothetical protein